VRREEIRTEENGRFETKEYVGPREDLSSIVNLDSDDLSSVLRRLEVGVTSSCEETATESYDRVGRL
jgi:hypothetical protein